MRKKGNTRQCTVSGCDKTARGSFCDMHWKRKQRGAPMNSRAMARAAQEKLSPFARLVEAASAFAEADAEDDEGYNRAEGELREAAWRMNVRVWGGRAGARSPPS